MLMISHTGSGKTTQLGQMLYRAGYTSQGGAIVCTQPRRVAAVSVAKRVAEEMDTKLGALVGYSIRFENVTSAETVIRYVSEGVLLREFLTDSELNNVSVVILDEAHERSLNCDILLGLIKRVLIKRRDIKLIVTSATLNSRRFSDFFAQAPVFHIPGRTYPVDVQFARSPTEDYVDAAVRQLLSIHVSQGPGDMLCFMTGQEDILATCELVGERLKLLNDPPKLLVLPLYSQLAADLQARIFQKAPPGVRKLIVSTNVCETSVTVDGIIYVVDAGFSKLKVYNPRIGMDTLQITPISQANANQRSGRAGRTAAGKAYRLFTERAYKDEMYIATIPEIQRTNITNTVLLLKSLGVDDLLDFDFMDSPPQEAITTSLFDLWALGAIDNLGALTPLGKSMTSFPMDPPLAKLLITSASRSPYACSDEILTIVAMLSVPAVFYRPRERMEEADATREKFFAAESDHLTLLNVYNQWRANGCADGWCARHFLHPQALRRAREIREQIAELMTGSSSSSSRRGADGVKKGGAGGGGGGGHKGAGLEILSCGRDTDVIRKCVAGSFYFQAAKLKGRGEYVNLRTSVTVQLHPTSALYGAGVLPEYIVYHDLVMTSKEYISTATAVEPGWLAELGFVFFSVRKRVYGGADPGEGDEGGGTGRGREKRMVELEIGRRMEMQVKTEEDREKDRTKRRAAQEEREKMGPGKVGRAGFGKEEKTVVVQGEVRKAVVKKRRMGV